MFLVLEIAFALIICMTAICDLALIGALMKYRDEEDFKQFYGGRSDEGRKS